MHQKQVTLLILEPIHDVQKGRTVIIDFSSMIISFFKCQENVTTKQNYWFTIISERCSEGRLAVCVHPAPHTLQPPRLAHPGKNVVSCIVITQCSKSMLCLLNYFCVINTWRLRNPGFVKAWWADELGTPALECVLPESLLAGGNYWHNTGGWEMDLSLTYLWPTALVIIIHSCLPHSASVKKSPMINSHPWKSQRVTLQELKVAVHHEYAEEIIVLLYQVP